jgi:hypothetical protein
LIMIVRIGYPTIQYLLEWNPLLYFLYIGNPK